MNLQRSSCRTDSDISSSCLKVGMRPGVSVRCNARRWSRCASAAWFASLANLREMPGISCRSYSICMHLSSCAILLEGEEAGRASLSSFPARIANKLPEVAPFRPSAHQTTPLCERPDTSDVRSAMCSKRLSHSLADSRSSAAGLHCISKVNTGCKRRRKALGYSRNSYKSIRKEQHIQMQRVYARIINIPPGVKLRV